jgi:hypothetical protein
MLISLQASESGGWSVGLFSVRNARMKRVFLPIIGMGLARGEREPARTSR